jgi:hypothetical protein
MAARSPFFANSMALRVIDSASPSSRTSTANVALLREPFGRPAGLPLCPGSNGRPICCFCAVFSAVGMPRTCLFGDRAKAATCSDRAEEGHV